MPHLLRALVKGGAEKRQRLAPRCLLGVTQSWLCRASEREKEKEKEKEKEREREEEKDREKERDRERQRDSTVSARTHYGMVCAGRGARAAVRMQGLATVRASFLSSNVATDDADLAQQPSSHHLQRMHHALLYPPTAARASAPRSGGTGVETGGSYATLVAEDLGRFGSGYGRRPAQLTLLAESPSSPGCDCCYRLRSFSTHQW